MKRLLHVIACLVLFAPALATAAPLKVVATTTDVAEVFREVGGDEVKIETLAKGYQDPHYLEAKPSFLVHMRKADALAYVGLELEVGWLPLLVEGSRNDRLRVGSAGNIFVGEGIDVLEVPTGEVSRAEGDVHPLGNPHFWLDPHNVLAMARTAESALVRLRPEKSATFAERRADFEARMNRAIARWEQTMAPWRGHEVVCYHKQWEYLTHWLGLDIVDYVEVKAGIPPSPRHVADLERTIESRQIDVIVMSNFFEPGPAEKLSERTGAKLITLPASVEGEDGVDDFFALFDRIVTALDGAFQNGSMR